MLPVLDGDGLDHDNGTVILVGAASQAMTIPSIAFHLLTNYWS
jgi:hypothetical protein